MKRKTSFDIKLNQTSLKFAANSIILQALASRLFGWMEAERIFRTTKRDFQYCDTLLSRYKRIGPHPPGRLLHSIFSGKIEQAANPVNSLDTSPECLFLIIKVMNRSITSEVKDELRAMDLLE